jgi:hypothetical protein
VLHREYEVGADLTYRYSSGIEALLHLLRPLAIEDQPRRIV